MISDPIGALPDNAEELEKSIRRQEQKSYPLKPGAEAKIIWNNPEKKEKTPYSIVYLHGFKGSQGEGDPVHRTIAKKFGCNLFLSRLYGHGQIKARKLDDLTPEKLIQSARVAFKIGQKIGNRVIVMGTSTGGTLALYMASLSACSSSIVGLILYSPLIHLYGIQSLLLENAAGRALLQLFGGKNHTLRSHAPIHEPENNIWYHSYQLSGALALGKTVQQLVNPALFSKICCPVFIGYYYKNRHNHDRVVSTPSIKNIVKKLGTPRSKIQLKNFPAAGTHVVCSEVLSAAVQEVIFATQQFMIEKMGLTIPD